MITALYSHLGRDPAPAMLMKQKAPVIARWVERMHAPESTWVEYAEDEDLVAKNTIPDTLKNLMRYIAQEYLPEISAHVAYANDWLANHESLEAGTNGCDKTQERHIGKAKFSWRGNTLETTVMPYRFYLLQRLQNCVAAAAVEDQTAIHALFEQTGLAELLHLTTLRRVERVNHLEVWGELRPAIS